MKISGLAYNAYYYDFSKGSQDKNGFDLTRLYLTFKKGLSENIGIRVTTDIGRVSNDQEKGYYRLYLKYGYVELKKPSWKVKLLVGLHYVPLLAFQENIWGYRSISKMLTDLEHKQTSSDLGLKLHGQFHKEYGEYAFSFVNGEGYNQPEMGKHKGFYGRISLRPFPISIHGLRLTGFASHIQHDQDSSTTLTTGFATLESNRLTLGAEFSAGNDKIGSQKTKFLGYSFFSVFKLTSKWTIIGRMDWFDPDTRTKKNSHLRKIIGIGYWISKDVELVFDYQGVQYDEGISYINSDILYTHLHFNF
ncbi:hypothetical protein ISS37_02695 [candidate division KSB1 bacterium]|nr:hypothetical protein [candidate division KSB1 bacterium]